MKQLRTDPTKYVLLRGSKTVSAVIRKIGLQYMLDFQSVGLPLCQSGSYEGYKTIIDGTTDIGLVSSQLPQDLQGWATRQRVEYTETQVAYDGVAVIVHAANPLKNLSLLDLRDVFSGRVTRWKSLGWHTDESIQIYSHDPLQGGYVTWMESVMGDSNMTLSAKILIGDAAIAKAVEQNPNAIGYVGIVAANNFKSNIIQVDGVYPSVKAIASNEYAIIRKLNLLSRKDGNQEVRNFIEYCLDENKGQRIIKEMGLVPVKKGDS